MDTVVLKQTSQSNADFWDFPAGTAASEGDFFHFITAVKEGVGSLIGLLSAFINEPWSYEKNDTAELISSNNLVAFDSYIGEIESPVMPPKKEFRVELIVRSIERGKPSICDDFEIW